VCCRKIKTRVRPVDNLLSGAPIRRGRVRPVFRRERSRAFFFCRNSGGGWQTRQHCRPTDRHGRLMDGVGVRRRRQQQQQQRRRRRRSTEVLCFGRMLSSARRPSSHTNYCYGRPARRGSAAADVTVHLCRRYIGTFVLPTGRLPHVYIYIFICTYHTRGTGNNDIMYIPHYHVRHWVLPHTHTHRS